MIYASREIKDRIAIGDDVYKLEDLGGGRVRLIPDPTQVIEPGTDINRELLQIMEDRIVMLMHRVFNDITANPFIISFSSVEGLTGNGVWDATHKRIEC